MFYQLLNALMNRVLDWLTQSCAILCHFL